MYHAWIGLPWIGLPWIVLLTLQILIRYYSIASARIINVKETHNNIQLEKEIENIDWIYPNKMRQ